MRDTAITGVTCSRARGACVVARARPTAAPARSARRWASTLLLSLCLLAAWSSPAAATMLPHQVGQSSRPAVSARCDSTLSLKSDGTAWAWGDNTYGQLGNGTTTSSETPVQVLTAAATPLPNIIAISSGCGFAVAVTGDGSVWAWGRDDLGQLGNGSFGPSTCAALACSMYAVQVRTSNVPAYVSGIEQVESGDGFTVALRGDGTVWAWGQNASGQLGNGNTTGPQVCGGPGCSNLALQVLDPGAAGGKLVQVKQVAASGTAALALTSQGSVRAWGDNTLGQLAQGAAGGNVLAPAPALTAAATPLTQVFAIAGGTDHFAAVTSTGAVAAWGSNSRGQVGTGSAGGTVNYATTVAGLSNVKAVAAGQNHTLAVRADGTVMAWGENTWGQLGDNTQVDRPAPVQVKDSTTPTFLKNVTSVAGGTSQSAAVRADGTIWTWGSDTARQLGYAAPPPSCGAQLCRMYAQQSQFVAGTAFKAIATAPYTSYGLRADGTVWAWGYSDDGELGIGVEDGGSSTPSQVVASGTGNAASSCYGASGSPLRNIIAVYGTGGGATALCADGTIWGWGDGAYGQLGRGNTSDSNFAVEVQVTTAPSYLTNITTIAGSDRVGFGRAADGTAWAWGRNGYGQLGNGGAAATNLATQVQTGGASLLQRVIAVGGDGKESDSGVALRDDGSSWAWGRNASAELGVGSNTGPDVCSTEACSQYAIQVLAGSTAGGLADGIAVDKGDQTVAVIKSDGSVWSAGDNDGGEIGTATTVDWEGYPRWAATDSSYSAMLTMATMHSGSRRTAYARTANGFAYAWGGNSNGQVGDNSGISTRPWAVPVKDAAGTGTLANVIAVSSGDEHGMALDASGTIWSWGSDSWGQLGICTSTYADRPLPVVLQLTCAANRSPNQVVFVDQYRNDATTIIPNGSITSDGVSNNVVFRYSVSDPDAGQVLTPYVEVRPLNVVFSSTCGGAGTTAGAATGSIAFGQAAGVSVPVTGLVSGTWYHWRACSRDAGGLSSPWYTYGTGGGDFKVDNSAPGGSTAGTRQVSAGCGYSLALRADGTVWATGTSAYGTLGNGATSGSAAVPVQVKLAPAGALALTNVVSIAAGCNHAVAVLGDGTVYAWGRDDLGQLGSAASTTCGATACTPYAARADAANLANVKAVAAGDAFSVALKADGSVWAWGSDAQGQLGNNVVGGSSATATQVKDTAGTGTQLRVKSIAAGDQFALALLVDGTVMAWGSNANYRLGANLVLGTNYPTPRQVLTAAATPLVDVRQVDGGGGHAVALTSSGRIYAWGLNSSGQLGVNSTVDGQFAALVRDAGSVTITGFASVSAGGTHTAAVKSDGTVWTWGANAKGQLGINSYAGTACAATCMTVPQALRDSGNVVVPNSTHAFFQVAAGDLFTLGLKPSSQVMAWGRNGSGEFGAAVGTTCPSTESCSPYLVASGFGTGVGFKQIAAGGWFSMALRADGTVWTWGDNGNGQLGNGTDTGETYRLQQVQVSAGAPLTGITMIAANDYSGYALKYDGTVITWGSDGYGQLGDNNTTTRDFAVAQVRTTSGAPDTGTILSGVTSIAAGEGNGAAVTDDGRAWVWGRNSYGQLTGGCCSQRLYAAPAKLVGGADVSNVVQLANDALNGDQFLALRSDGTVWGWGQNQNGQLAQGATGPEVCNVTACSQWARPAKEGAGLANLADVTMVGSMDNAAVALKVDGTVEGWGTGPEVGNNSGVKVQYAVPVRSTSGAPNTGTVLSNIVGVDAGETFGHAWDATGQLWSWGNNGAGQLGDNSRTDRPYAQRGVTSTSPFTPHANVQHADGGQDHTTTLRSDGTVWSVGMNYHGMLADCTWIDENMYVPLRDPCTGDGPPHNRWTAQRRNGNTTDIPVNTWTPDGITNNVVISWEYSDPDPGQSVTPYLEFAPLGTAYAARCGDGAAANVRTGATVAASAGAGAWATFNITGLTPGMQYHWRSCSVDSNGNPSGWSEFGRQPLPDFGVDNVLPSNPGTIFDGPITGVDATGSDSLTTMYANWPMSIDTGGSGLVSYDYCLTTTAGGANCAAGALRTWTSNGYQTALTATGLTLANNTTYYVCVRTRDGAGNVAAAVACSNGQLVSFGPTSLSPASAPQGRQGLTVQVNGTGFRSTDVVAFLASPDIGIVSTTFVSATRIDLVLNIDSTGTAGARTVSVTHVAPDGSVGQLANGFTVTVPTLTLGLSTLGYTSPSRTGGGGPWSIGFGSVLDGSTVRIGPPGSGQATPGSAVQASIVSDTSWYLQGRSTNLTNAALNTIAAGQLAWRHNATVGAWNPFGTVDANLEPMGTGGAIFDYDWQLAVPAGQQPGVYNGTVTYTAVAAA